MASAMSSLNQRAFSGLFFLVIVLGAILFLSAWTLDYWQAWVFLAAFSLPSLAITLYLMKFDPKLLERRLHAGAVAEKERSQKVIQAIATIAFILIIAFPAIDHRFGWSKVATTFVILGDGFVALGLSAVFFVYRANTFASAVVEVNVDQQVISTGPYAIVRHPMYTSALFMLLGVPPALGSFWGLIAFIPMLVAITWRLIEEERFLDRNLPGYAAYRSLVKYRLVPFVW